MQEFDYSLDIIITKLALHQKDGHFSGFIKFGEHSIEVLDMLTSNYQCGRSIVVRSTQQDLRKRLESCPIVLEIFRDKTEKIAEVSIPWPEIALIRLENPAFTCDTQIECVTFPEGLVALVLKVAKVQMLAQKPMKMTESVECLTESEDDGFAPARFAPARFAANDYKIINGRVVRVASDQCMQLPPRVCPKPNRPVTSGLETERFKWPPKTCHELFGNRLAGEKCHLCQEQLLTAKGPLCDSCGGVSVNTKMTDQMKLFDHHLCIQDCPMDPVARQFPPESPSRCSTDSPTLACNSEQPVCCECCEKTGKLCEKCSQNKKPSQALTKRIRLSRTSKKSQLITLTNKDGQKKKYKIEVEFVHAKKAAKRCAKEKGRRQAPCRPSLRAGKLRPSAQYAEQIYGPKTSMFLDSSIDDFETTRRRRASEKAGNRRTERKSQTRESRVSSDLMTETSDDSTEKQSNEDEVTRGSKLRSSKTKKKKSKRRSSDSDESQTAKVKSSKGRKKSKRRSSESEDSQTAKVKSKKKSKRRSSDSDESQTTKTKSKKKSKRRTSDTDDSQKSQESQEGRNQSIIREPKKEPKSPKPTSTPAAMAKDVRQSLMKDGETSKVEKSQQKPLSKPITEEKRRQRESDDIENEDMNQDQGGKRRPKGAKKSRNRESEGEEDDEDTVELMDSRKRSGKKRKPGDKTDQHDRDQEFSIAIEPDEIGDRLQRGAKKGKGPSRIKISIKPVEGESGDKAAMKGFCRLRGGGNNETPTPHFQTRKEFIKYMKSKMTKRYSYKFGRKYPGVVIGHNHNVEVPRVPSYMGWLWNIKTLGINKIRRGWKPGAIRKPIKEMMSYFLDPYPYDTLPVSKRQKAVGPSPSNQAIDAPQRDKPTLRVQKKNGEYSITMNPLNEAAAPGESPYISCRPIKFTLGADERGRKLAQVRDIVKAQGYQLCKCDSLTTCQCRDQAQNWMLQCELDRLTECLQMQEPISYKDLRISESEMDIEFTPPSVVMRPKLKKRADNAAVETQYDQKDYLAGQTYTCLGGSMDQGQGGTGGDGAPGAGLSKGAKAGKKGETNVMGQPKGKGTGPGAGAGGQQTAGKSGVVSKVGLKNAQNEKTADQQGAMKPGEALGNVPNRKVADPKGVGRPGADGKAGQKTQQNGKTAEAGKPGVGGKVGGPKNVPNDKITAQQGAAKPGVSGKAGVKNAQNDATKKDGRQNEENSNTQKGDPSKTKPGGKTETGKEGLGRNKQDGAVPFSVLLKDPCNNVRPCCPVLPPCCLHQCRVDFRCKPNLCCQTQKC